MVFVLLHQACFPQPDLSGQVGTGLQAAPDACVGIAELPPASL